MCKQDSWSLAYCRPNPPPHPPSCTPAYILQHTCYTLVTFTCSWRLGMSIGSSLLSLVMVTQREMITITCWSLEERVQPEKSTDVHSLLSIHLLTTLTTILWWLKNVWGQRCSFSQSHLGCRAVIVGTYTRVLHAFQQQYGASVIDYFR